MALLNAYALAEGHNNVAGLIPVYELINGEPTHTHANSLGTFRAATEFIGLDEIAQDMGGDVWDWTFAALLFSEIEIIETDILNGARSGPVTVETKGRYGQWVQRNAILTLPQSLPRQGIKIGGLVFGFRDGQVIP